MIAKNAMAMNTPKKTPAPTEVTIPNRTPAMSPASAALAARLSVLRVLSDSPLSMIRGLAATGGGQSSTT